MDLLRTNSFKIVGTLVSQNLEAKNKKADGAGYISGNATIVSNIDGRDCEFDVSFYTNQLTKDGKQSQLYTSYSKMKDLVGKKVEVSGEIRENRFFSKNAKQMVSSQQLSGRFIRGVAESTANEASFEMAGFVVDSLKEKQNKDGDIYRYDLVLGQSNYGGDMMGRFTLHINPTDVEIVRGVQKYQVGETVFVHGILRHYVEKKEVEVNNEGGFGEAVVRTYTNRQSNYFITGGSAPIIEADKGKYPSDVIRNLCNEYKARDVKLAEEASNNDGGSDTPVQEEVKPSARQVSLI